MRLGVMIIAAGAWLGCGTEDNPGRGATASGTGGVDAAGGGDSGGQATGGSSTGGTGGSGTGAPGGAGGSGPTAEEACAALAAAQCAKEQECYPAGLATTFGDAATCSARRKLGCLAELGSPGTATTPIDLEACTGAWAAVACAEYDLEPPAACAPAPGGLANGAGCFYGSQCRSAFCAGDGSACGTCEEAPAAGEPCVAGGCGSGLVCNASSVCVVPGELDDACAANAPCRNHLRCGAGQCKPRLAAGGACGAQGTVKDVCDYTQDLGCNSWSNPSSYVCATNKYATAGTWCWNGAQYRYCTGGSLCVFNAQLTSGTCLAPAADGEACSADPAKGHQCVSPASCVGGTCQMVDPTGCI